MSIQLHQISISNGGVPKHPIEQAEVTVNGVAGDRQKNTKVHGGPKRAVSLFSLEIIQALQAEGHPIVPGSTGENLTLAGLSPEVWAELKPGSRLKIGQTLEIEITGYANPCNQIVASFTEGNSNRISQKLHPGWSRLYAQVITAGNIKTGDTATIE